MRRVNIIGCPGAGKSTFARKLSEKTGLELFYLDMIWHKPDKTTVARDEFDLRLNEIFERDFLRWILDFEKDQKPKIHEYLEKINSG